MSNTPIRHGAIVALCLVLSACAAGEEHVVMVEPEPILSEPVASEAAMSSPVVPASVDGPGIGVPRPGVVTAGDIDDSLNLAAFRAHQTRAARDYGLPVLALQTPVRLALTGPEGTPAPGVSLSLRRPGAARPFFEGVSGVDGRLTVFPTLLGERPLDRVELRVFRDGSESQRRIVGTGPEETRVSLAADHAWTPSFLDLVFVIDTSGSMSDEHEWLRREFAAIVRDVQRAAPDVDIRFGLVAYRSPGDDYAVRSFGFTGRPRQMAAWLDTLDATGGAGGAEVVERGLATAMDLPWRSGAGERLVFLVGDEPPDYGNVGTYLAAATEAARRQIQVFGLGASDTEGDLELLMRQAALMTGGRYLFLTDDSGVGNAHGEPDIPCYRVTSLKSLLVRVLRSELTGRRQEAAPGEVIRTVGNYRNGTCSQ